MLAEDFQILQDILKEPGLDSYQEILEVLILEMSAERGCLWLEKKNSLLYHGDEELRESFPFSRQVLDSVLDKGRSFISFDTGRDDRIEPTSSIRTNNVRSCLCAACYDRSGNVIAIAYFDNGINFGLFSERDLELLQQVLSILPEAMPVAA